jgi:hypothetical protein
MAKLITGAYESELIGCFEINHESGKRISRKI